ncbi:carbon starvation protein A [Desulfolutivibrio sulfoxidireducens]|uniref:carbon starvation CstA family protein n=1 Tax=Desulfolutivibrio sulfoxidireducens TaxID=2773299 RepID=UPI00159DC107|nr:carbon starvation protein A [Desulfolutivibrio sulfoxidireducens]QLA20346.1 carbon starvation protein A [Desulfolutivibrio sulfoxidireducens]
MNAFTLVFAALCLFALGYRFYGLFIATRVLRLDPGRPTPAVAMADGVDYVKTDRFVLFGHHFAAIAAAGPLLGPVLAAQYGYLPGALWILIGCVLAGAVHDMVVLFCSVRHKGRGLARIARLEIGSTAGGAASVAVLFILVLTLAGLSLAVVGAMHDSPWGTFTVAATIPIALLMGLYLHVWRRGDVRGASLLGAALLFLTILAGPFVAENPDLAKWFTFSRKELSIFIPAYGLVASILPVWLLLCPRDYLSTYLKIGTIGLLALGILWVRPDLSMPALTPFIHGGGPIIPGAVYPFVFITIACGALSGFHAIIGTGTTPKMIGSERDILFVGYGAMLVEGLVAIMALIAACVLVPADYFAINAAPEVFARMGLSTVNLDGLSRAVGENIQGRTGGAVSLAVGMAHIFSALPFMKGLTAYWYHFAIMFEAVFILTAVDTGTRVGRFFVQEMLARVWPRFGREKWWPGIAISGSLFTLAWGYLVYTGDIGTIWPLFGMSNQLLAACGLIIATTMLIRLDRAGYAWMTAVPGIFMAVTTMVAGYQGIMGNYLPKGRYLLATLGVTVMVLMAVVMVMAVRRWMELLRRQPRMVDEYGDTLRAVVPE